MDERGLIFRAHAVRRMFERNITTGEVAKVVAGGEVIESYPDDRPYASRLMLGFVDQRPIHIVAADIPDSNEVVIITVYEPDPTCWDDTFRRRLLL